MLMRLIAAALLAGLVSGLLVSGLQAHFVTPLIVKAESFEGAHSHSHSAEAGAGHTHAADEAPHSHDGTDAAHSHEAGHSHDGEWQPSEGFERLAYTALATVGTAIGYALLLGALLLVLNVPLDVRTLIAWGLGAFVATTLAPAIGLAPSLPGTGESPLMPRQLWWFVTAAATGSGLYILSHHWRSALAVAGGLALVALPHVWGAPPAVLTESTVPVQLAAQFAARSIALSLVLWVSLALALAVALARLGETSERTA